MGRTVAEIAKRLGVTERAVYMSLRRSQPAQQIIHEELQREAVDSDVILTRLSDMFNADIGDIIEPAEIPCLKCVGIPDDELPVCDQCSGSRFVDNPRIGCYKPITEWPVTWRRMLSSAEVKELFEHSRDGEGASWDKIGDLVKIKFVDPLKLIELAMQHKRVDAKVNPNDKLAGAVGDLASSIDQAIAEGRQRAARRNKLPINVTPDSSQSE